MTYVDIATLPEKHTDAVPAIVEGVEGSPRLRWVSRQGTSTEDYFDPDRWSYWDYRLVSLLVEDEWVEVSGSVFDNAKGTRRRYVEDVVPNAITRTLYFIHRDDYVKPDPDAELVNRIDRMRMAADVDSDTTAIIAAVREHDAKARP